MQNKSNTVHCLRLVKRNPTAQFFYSALIILLTGFVKNPKTPCSSARNAKVTEVGEKIETTLKSGNDDGGMNSKSAVAKPTSITVANNRSGKFNSC